LDSANFSLLQFESGGGFTSIGEGSFARTSIGPINLSGVTSIPNNLFLSCPELNVITIPNGVTSIGQGAFVNCNALTEVRFQGTIPAAGINENVFPGDLRAKFLAGGAGTYTRPAGGTTWTKK